MAELERSETPITPALTKGSCPHCRDAKNGVRTPRAQPWRAAPGAKACTGIDDARTRSALLWARMADDPPRRRRGRPRLDAGGPPTAKMCVFVPAGDYDKLYQLASRRRETMPELIRRVLRRELEPSYRS